MWQSSVKQLAPHHPYHVGVDVNSTARTCQQTTPVIYFKRTITILLLDHLILKMETRFTALHCNTLKGLALIPAALAKMATQKEDLQSFINMYKDDLPLTKTIAIDAELECWRVKWPGVPSESLSQTTAGTLSYTAPYPNINTLLRILCSLQVTSCTAERAISGLKRLKTYLRCSMRNEQTEWTGTYACTQEHHY